MARREAPGTKRITPMANPWGNNKKSLLIIEFRILVVKKHRVAHAAPLLLARTTSTQV